jgi:signal transduction histidine kinase
MDYFSKLRNQLVTYVFITLVFLVLLIGAGLWLTNKTMPNTPWLGYAIVATLTLGLIIWISAALAQLALTPLRYVWQAMLHVTPQHSDSTAPDLQTIKVGKELVTSMVLQVYQMASTTNSVKAKDDITQSQASQTALAITRAFPLPILAINHNLNIIFANDAALRYLNQTDDAIIGNNFYSTLDLAFSNDNTFDKWLADSRANKATATMYWQRVRARRGDEQDAKQFDLAASYNKDSPNGTEIVVTLFDKTEEYAQDDDGLGFVALAVHELRTPLTTLRGFIEVFEDELGDKLDDEMRGFMYKMQASAQQLASFVSNILNVARIEDDQLELKLSEENWPQLIQETLDDLTIRAQVHGKIIEFKPVPDLPTVAVDKVSVYEVLTNLIDNAMKYSGTSTKILITTAVNQDGLVETNVIDYGVGIPTSVMPHLFEKFQRNHRNRAQIGGTGLGLYLSRAIINAQGGNIWMQSKENLGSTVSFTLKPYSLLANELKNSDNKDITRGAHGWIKNHSFYRR